MSIALATPDEPDVFVVAPLGDGWTVLTPDGTQRIAPPQPWDLGMATIEASAITGRRDHAARFRWVNC